MRKKRIELSKLFLVALVMVIGLIAVAYPR